MNPEALTVIFPSQLQECQMHQELAVEEALPAEFISKKILKINILNLWYLKTKKKAMFLTQESENPSLMSQTSSNLSWKISLSPLAMHPPKIWEEMKAIKRWKFLKWQRQLTSKMERETNQTFSRKLKTFPQKVKKIEKKSTQRFGWTSKKVKSSVLRKMLKRLKIYFC